VSKLSSVTRSFQDVRHQLGHIGLSTWAQLGLHKFKDYLCPANGLFSNKIAGIVFLTLHTCCKEQPFQNLPEAIWTFKVFSRSLSMLLCDILVVPVFAQFNLSCHFSKAFSISSISRFYDDRKSMYTILLFILYLLQKQ